MIRTIFTEEPNFPVEDNHADCTRYEINGLFIDATTEPTQDEINAFLNPPVTELTKQELLAQLSTLTAKVNAL